MWELLKRALGVAFHPLRPVKTAYYRANHYWLAGGDRRQRLLCDISESGNRLDVTVWVETEAGLCPTKFSLDRSPGRPRFECDPDEHGEVLRHAR